MRVVVVTSITAGRDSLKEDQVTDGADFVAFCDEPVESSTWEVRKACNLFVDPLRNAKIHKVLSHLYFPEHDYSLWMDARFELVTPVVELIERYLKDVDALFLRHKIHKTLPEEVEACIKLSLDDPEVIREQAARYKLTDHRFQHGLPVGGVILRRHAPVVEAFNAAWWAEICRGSRRDQLSLLYAAERSGLRWGYFPAVSDAESVGEDWVVQSPHFRLYPHRYDLRAADSPRAITAPLDDGPVRPWILRQRHLEGVAQERERYARSLEAELEQRTKRAQEAERYARSLEAELEKRAEWAKELERYARSLETCLAERVDPPAD